MLFPIYQKIKATCAILEIPEEDLVREANVATGREFLEDPQAMATADEMARLFEAAALLYGKEDFSIVLPKGLAESRFSPTSLAFTLGSNLAEGIENVAKYKALCGPAKLNVLQSEGVLNLSLETGANYGTLASDAAVMEFVWLIETCRSAASRKVVPSKVILPGRPTNLSGVQKFFGTQIEISGQASLQLTEDDYLAANISHIPGVMGSIKMELDRLLKKTKASSLWSDRCTLEVANLFPSRRMSVSEVARRLGVAPRTLQRKIALEGASFQSIVSAERLKLAKFYLSNTKLNHDEVSALLGFNEPNSFFRFFKQKTNISPSEFRASGEFAPD